MTYNSNFVATVKVNGKILRENKDVVALPFGSEYSIYLKNQNSVRALVRVFIDGQPMSDVSDGWIIIGANDTLELERFVKNQNFNKGNKFKFIERTSQIEDHRGIGVDDGLIRIEYKFETPQPIYTIYNNYPYTYYTNCGGLQGGGIQGLQGVDGYSGQTTTTTGATDSFNVSSVNIAQPSSPFRSASMKSSESKVHAQNMSVSCFVAETSMDNDAGITVAGSESTQKFSWGSWFPTEATSHVIVLRLVGKTKDNTPVAVPVTVKEKPVCVTCGKVNKATYKFCGRCGTALQLF